MFCGLIYSVDCKCIKICFCLFAAQVGSIGNNQAVFQNDANTQVGQQFAPSNNYPNDNQGSK